jgi:hypothetical protein
MIDAARFYAASRPDKIARRTVGEVLIELLAAKKARGKSDRYLADLRIRLGRFAKDWPLDIGSIAGPDIQGWLDRPKWHLGAWRTFGPALAHLWLCRVSRICIRERQPDCEG